MDLPRIPERKLTAEVESVTKETKSSEFALRLSGSDAVEFLSPEKSENPFPCTNQEALVSGTNRERERVTQRETWREALATERVAEAMVISGKDRSREGEKFSRPGRR